MISVVIPMYNEAATIKEVLARFIERCCELSGEWEIVLVNDGSTDDSLSLAQEVAQKEPRLRIVTYPVNRGRGYALRRGFAEARGEIVVTTEADLSWGEDIVARLADALNAHPEWDMVVASPNLPGGGYKNVPGLRVFLSRLGNKLLRWAVYGKLTMLSGMTRGYRRRVLDSLELESDHKEIHPEIISKALALGFKAGEIPATLTWGEARRGKLGARSTFKLTRVIMTHLAFSFSEAPILLMGSLALFFILASTLAVLYLFYLDITGRLFYNRPLMTWVVIWSTVGVQTLLFCFLAHQIKKIQDSVHRVQAKLKLMDAEKDEAKDEDNPPEDGSCAE